MKKLIPMTDFVLELSDIGSEIQSLSHQNKNRADRFSKLVTYANFLKQPLKLEMFVPCDEDGNVLEMPVNYDVWFELHNKNIDGEKGTIGFLLHEEYQKAKEKVIFEGFNAKRLYGFISEIIIELKNKEIFFYYDFEKKIFFKYFNKYLRTVEDLIPYNLEFKNEILLF